MNTYQDAVGTLAFIHVEHADNTTPYSFPNIGPGKTRLGIAWNAGPPDGTPIFSYAGHILSPHDDRPGGVNITGAPYIIKNIDGTPYFYLYFNDMPSSNSWGHIAVARAPVAAVQNSASLGVASGWEKYNNGSWTAGMGGQSSALPGLWPIIVHGDSAQSTFNGRYYLAGWRPLNWDAGSGNNPAEVVVYSSCDGINWTEELHLGQSTDEDVEIRYVTFVNSDGTDNAVVGENMYLYLVRSDNGFDPRRTEVHRYALHALNSPCAVGC